MLAVYNAIAGRKQDRAEVSDQVSNIARGSGDLARQLAEFDRRLGFMESKIETVLERALSSARPLANEIEELSRLVNQLADTVAQHDAALAAPRDNDHAVPPYAAAELPPAAKRRCGQARRCGWAGAVSWTAKFRPSAASTATASSPPFATASKRSGSICICSRL